MTKRRVLTVVMDGIGIRDSSYGNAFALAKTPALDWLKCHSLYRNLFAHGPFVGLPSKSDIGNSEVGHNALGAGKVYDQGAKLVANAINSGEMFEGDPWRRLVEILSGNKKTLHFIGLLSDGNVHSHCDHLYKMMQRAKQDGVGRVRIHCLLDGRDVGPKTAETYIEQLESFMNELRSDSFDVAVASGGGRMTTTMDRYEADWSMVERGWNAHVLGQAEHEFDSMADMLHHFRKDTELTDQNFPAFTIKNKGQKGIIDGDAVVLWNFRGDRAIEISRAFTEADFDGFDRKAFPSVFFAGMMQYDGDLKIPETFLVNPPKIEGTLSEHLIGSGFRQFACSETQKFGHVTYFWNGNRSDYFDKSMEDYVEIPSELGGFDQTPWMKAHEITEATIAALRRPDFQIGRINYANGDMVGHTGSLQASIVAVGVVDLQIARLIDVCRKTDTILIVTADHGNCDEMFDSKADPDSDWFAETDMESWPSPKTSHTLNPVPFYFYDPKGIAGYELNQDPALSIGHVAGTIVSACGAPSFDDFLDPVVRRAKS
ncbi:MAG: 2,3-bisphosphoglycerate-independent phosphoglycerate mutase [Pseudobacteriovorax sp.]|nr:2,3-bisphosphoglycerate-independent phosphoglycerate mutase [Pseudobacteriovorax sp.]